MIRKTTKKTAEAVGPENFGLYREVTVELVQHYHENSKKLVKTEEGERTEGKLYRLAKPGEKAVTQLMDSASFAVVGLVPAPESAIKKILAAEAAEPAPEPEEPAAEAEDLDSGEDTDETEMDNGDDADCEDAEDDATDEDTDDVTDEAEDAVDAGNSEDEMAAKKTTTKKTTTKKTAAKKTAAKKAKKPAAAKVAKVETSDDAEVASSGQSGPAIKIVKINAKEAKVLEQLNHGSAPQTIEQIAVCFKGKSKAIANSWVRNSLRRPVRGGLVKNCARGTYGLTAKGKKFEAPA